MNLLARFRSEVSCRGCRHHAGHRIWASDHWHVRTCDVAECQYEEATEGGIDLRDFAAFDNGV